MTRSTHALAAALAALTLAGCSCEERTNKRFPKIELLDEQGNARTAVEFGQVQVAFTGKKTVRVRNAGSSSLTLTGAQFSSALFGLGTPLPVSVEVNGEYELPLTFTPTTADLRETGTVTLASDDPERPSVQLSLAGTGVAATAVLQPQTLAFGAVYTTESKTLTLALTNSGSNELPVNDVRFTAGTPPSVSADFAPMKKTLAGGETVMVSVRYAPTQEEVLGGAVELVFPEGIGNKTVPLTGTGIHAVPRLCFKFDDSAFEQCADVATTFADLRFGSLCDGRLYPPDAGLAALCAAPDGGQAPYQRSGTLYVRNEGNTRVSYTLQFQAQAAATCDAGSAIDFAFANAPALPDGGTQASWTVPVAALPATETAPRPWETAPLAVTYRATSACTRDAADQARVIWTRQGEPLGTTRPPGTLIFTLTGKSLLPSPQANPFTFTGNPPVPQDVTLVSNSGDGPMRVTAVALWQSADGGASPGVPCAQVDAGPCRYFSWADDPAARLPLVLEGTPTPSAPVAKVLGRLAYGTPQGDGGYEAPFGEFRVWAVVETSDPYSPRVAVPLTGRRN